MFSERKIVVYGNRVSRLNYSLFETIFANHLIDISGGYCHEATCSCPSDFIFEHSSPDLRLNDMPVPISSVIKSSP